LDAKLYMVSLGPGEAEMITVKGLEALKTANAICIPTKSEDRSFSRSMTHKIVTDLMQKFNFSKTIIPVYTPMLYQDEDWEAQVEVIISAIDRYGNVAFVTLGDAGIYSTVYYLLDIIKQKYPQIYDKSEVIAGVTSFSYASSKAKKALCVGESALEITPLPIRDVPKSIIYMRPPKGMDSSNLIERGEFWTFERLGFEDEKIKKGLPDTIKGYMTLIIDFFKKQ